VYPEFAAPAFKDEELRIAMESGKIMGYRRGTDSSGGSEAVARVRGG